MSVVCFEHQIDDIKRIFEKYSIRSKENSNEKVVFIPIKKIGSSIQPDEGYSGITYVDRKSLIKESGLNDQTITYTGKSPQRQRESTSRNH